MAIHYVFASLVYGSLYKCQIRIQVFRSKLTSGVSPRIQVFRSKTWFIPENPSFSIEKPGLYRRESEFFDRKPGLSPRIRVFRSKNRVYRRESKFFDRILCDKPSFSIKKLVFLNYLALSLPIRDCVHACASSWTQMTQTWKKKRCRYYIISFDEIGYSLRLCSYPYLPFPIQTIFRTNLDEAVKLIWHHLQIKTKIMRNGRA